MGEGDDLAFAAELIESQIFISFVDTYFEKDVNNMMVYLSYKNSGFLEAYDNKFKEREEQISSHQS